VPPPVVIDFSCRKVRLTAGADSFRAFAVLRRTFAQHFLTLRGMTDDRPERQRDLPRKKQISFVRPQLSRLLILST